MNAILAWVRKRLSSGDGDDVVRVSANDFGFHLDPFHQSLVDDQSVFAYVEERWESEQDRMKKLQDSPYSASIFSLDDKRRGSLDSVDDMKRKEKWMGPMKRRR